jgi:queuine tRNA-ribosyltransferase
VRAVGVDDLAAAGVRVVMTNALHLRQRPGMTTIAALGGAKRFIGWDGPLMADSGGFQALSLIRENARYGRIDADGLIFTPEGRDKRLLLTPEKSIESQMRLGADVLFCLDDCTHAEDSQAEQEASVARTLAWAKRCRAAFDEQCARRRLDARPLLFAAVQGGRDPELRRRCAEGLLAIGFDGYGFGGWPLDSDGALLEDMLALTRELIGDAFPMHALGVGHPGSVTRCTAMGYRLFDSALPTRDARRGRLYSFAGLEPDLSAPHRDWLRTLYLQDEMHMKAAGPLDESCTALCCTRYSTGYLRHLFRIEDPLFFRLATIHNLAFMTRLTGRLAQT